MKTAYAAGREANIRKFQQLLRELFQFDCADLDFGIYRIMNHKRDAVERFIVDKLPHAVSNELGRGALEEEHQAVAALEEATLEVEESLGSNAIDDDGELASNFHDTPLGKRYLKARSRVHTKGRIQDAIETDIYNHLYTFFSRYYEDGDFISKRRYSRRQQYAIPYNGEEVYLHWANSDQYYVKTGEHFNDYDWIAPNGVKVHFQLKTADVEHNNVKGDKRFFIPRLSAIQCDRKSREVTIPFEYRPLNSRERNQHGNTNQQEKIIAESVGAIPENAGSNADILSALTGERHRNGNDETVTHLEYQLRRYTRRNTSDFFIHKYLKGFLSRELDFYLKNEVLNLDDLSTAGENIVDGWFQMMRLIKLVGTKIIDFLAQIENFQKMLWEKRKFIVETQYCITVGNIDTEFYPEIISNDAQWDEWRELFGINGADRSKTFLEFHPTLVLDTRHFSSDFIDRLLASFDDLDEMTDGLLVHSENWQALNLLEKQYYQQLRCIYIDPPYNTAATEIIYKNGYKHSSYLSFMADRLTKATSLLDPNSAYVIAIDDTEMVNLSRFLDASLTMYNRNTVVVNHHPAGSGLEGTNVSNTHEYALFMSPLDTKVLRGGKKDSGVNQIGFVRTGTAESNLRSGRPNSFYAFLVDENASEIMGVEAPPNPNDIYPTGKTDEGFTRIYPISDDGTERVWRRSYKTIQASLDKGEVICKNSKSTCLITDQTGKRCPLFSNWTDTKYNAGVHGSNLLKDLFGGNVFSYPKSIYTVRDCIDACIQDSSNATILDHFAGSGTTGHAVINLNREDDGLRKFILVEMGEYFDTVLLPRIKKVTFAPEWKDGLPKRESTPEEAQRSPRLVKYIRLESYEDALNSIGFDNTSEQLNLEEQIEDYLLKYMLQWETKDSETLLNVENLSRPFTYSLKVRVDGETQQRTADIPETFNYLLGLNVRSRRVYDDESRRYLVYRGETRESPGQDMVVIWRETEGWEEADFERDREFVAEQKMTDGADSIYVNSSSCIIGAKSVDPLFKERMFAGTSA